MRVSKLFENVTSIQSVLDVLQKHDLLGSTSGETVKMIRNAGLAESKVEEVIKEITGQPTLKFGNDGHSNLIFLCYIAQNFIRNKNSPMVHPGALITKSEEDVAAFFKRVERGDFGSDYRKTAKDSVADMTAAEVADEVKNTGKFKKGSKTVLAIEIFNASPDDKAKIMDRYQKELGMSILGARTYFYTLKKKLAEKQMNGGM